MTPTAVLTLLSLTIYIKQSHGSVLASVIQQTKKISNLMLLVQYILQDRYVAVHHSKIYTRDHASTIYIKYNKYTMKNNHEAFAIQYCWWATSANSTRVSLLDYNMSFGRNTHANAFKLKHHLFTELIKIFKNNVGILIHCLVTTYQHDQCSYTPDRTTSNQAQPLTSLRFSD